MVARQEGRYKNRLHTARTETTKTRQTFREALPGSAQDAARDRGDGCKKRAIAFHLSSSTIKRS